MTPEQRELRRRLRAARELAGHESVDDLADAINEAGLRRGVLYGYEQGRKTPKPRDLAAIAKACGVPVEWFSVDFARLAEIATPTQAEDRVLGLAADEADRQRTHPDSRPEREADQDGRGQAP